MRICKYCKKPILENNVWNPDREGNGYHHACLCEMEFRSRDKQIYDKGRADMLDKIRAEIERAVWQDVIVSPDGTDETRIPCLNPDDVFEIIDKYRESEE